MRSARNATASLAVLALGLPASAAAAPKVLVDLPAGQIGVNSDGKRFSAWSPSGGKYPVDGVDYSFLRDSRTGRTRRYTPPNGCRLGDLAAGVGVIGCADGNLLPRGIPRRLVRLKTRRTFKVRTSRKHRKWLRSAHLFGFGKHWMRMERCPGHNRPCKYGYVNWRTGEVRRRSFTRAEAGPNPRYDLDSRNLRPFARKLPRVYYGMTFEERGLNLALRRRVVNLSRCAPLCNSPQLSTGLVSWVSNREAFAYRLADGARFRWSFSEVAGVDDNENSGISVAHTAHEILVTVPRNGRDGSDPRVRIYRIPR